MQRKTWLLGKERDPFFKRVDCIDSRALKDGYRWECCTGKPVLPQHNCFLNDSYGFNWTVISNCHVLGEGNKSTILSLRVSFDDSY